jgi:hypothetical protein
MEEQGIDALIVSKRCEVPDRAENYDAMYDTITDVLMGPDTFDGLLHLLDCHLVPVSLAIAEGYRRLEDDFQRRYINGHLMLFGIDIVLTVVSGWTTAN